jgi:hypothetical protein
MLAARPDFTAIVVITLALGVGANALIFTAIDAILLRRRRHADTRTLVSVYNAQHSTAGPFLERLVSGLRGLARCRHLPGIAAYGGISVSLDTGAKPNRWSASWSPETTFGCSATPRVGRRSCPMRIVAAHPARRRVSYRSGRTGCRTPAAIGREIQLNGASYVVIGVAPPRFVGATSAARRTSGCRWRCSRKCGRPPRAAPCPRRQRSARQRGRDG